MHVYTKVISEAYVKLVTSFSEQTYYTLKFYKKGEKMGHLILKLDCFHFNESFAVCCWRFHRP